MNLFNPIEELLRLAYGYGAIWAVVAVLVVAYSAFAPYHRSVLAGMLLLLCTQVWYAPVYSVSRGYRWWVIAILVFRGILRVRSVRLPYPESKLPRLVIGALAVMSVASALWAKHAGTAFFLSASLAVGIVFVFVVLWALQDQMDFLGSFPAAAVRLAFFFYGAGFLILGIALLLGSEQFVGLVGFGGRYSGIFMNPNMAGLLGAMLFPIVVAAPREFLGSAAWMRVPAILFLAPSIFMSGSRSALIGSFMALVLLAVYRSKIGTLFLIGVGAFGVWAISVYAPIQDVDQSMFGHITRTKHISTLSGRLELWEMGWNAAQESPIIGLGWGASRSLGAEFDVDQIINSGGLNFASNLHSAHVQMLVDLGMVGLGLFWLFSFLVVRGGWRILRGPRSPRNELSMLVFASFLGMLADTFVHGGVFSIGSPSALVFWTFAAIVLKQADRITAESMLRSLPNRFLPPRFVPLHRSPQVAPVLEPPPTPAAAVRLQ